VTGIVLAGGRSSRFGSDKLGISYRGMPLLHHAVLRLSEVCPEVIVVMAPDAGEPGLPIGVRASVTRDPTVGEGPLAGLHAGLLAAAGADWAVVAGGDMPELQTAVLLEMLRVAGEAQTDAVALQDGDLFRPLPCVLRAAPALDATHMLLHAGRRSLRELLQSLRTSVIDEPTWHALDPARRTLRDVDRPEDLDE
jgi:molybdopterin-guanine dinucleotide biosynthesis protein A